MKLADPDRLVVWSTGDGSYVFSNPMAVHHAAASLDLGLLTVLADNRVWNAVRRSTIAVYPEGAAATATPMPFTSLEPAPDYPKIVEAYGGHGAAVEDPDTAADLTSVLCLVGSVFAVLSRYAVLFWNQGLHQGASLSLDKEENISNVFWLPLVVTITGFVLLFVALVLLRTRSEIRLRRVHAMELRERMA